MYGAHCGLDNLIAIVDVNGLQIDGDTSEVMALGDISQKFSAFGWDTQEVDGHDIEALHAVFTLPMQPGKPRAVVAQTTKGRGVSFMENLAQWHGVTPTEEQAQQAYAELQRSEEGGEG